MKEKDQLIKHGTIMFIAAVFSGVFNYGFHIAMIKMLGPADYRIISAMLGLFMIITLPANTIQTVLAKYIASFNARKEFSKMSYLIMRSIRKIATALFVMLILFLVFSRQIARNQQFPSVLPVIIMGPILYLGVIMPVYYGAIQGVERFTALGLIQILGGFSRVSFAIILVLFGLGVNGALLSSLVTSFIILAACLWILRDIWIKKPYDKEIGRDDIYNYVKPVAIAYICYGIITYIDVIFVNHYFAPVQAGYYSVVSMIGKAFLFAPMAFASAMFPKVSGQHELNKKTRHLLSKTLIYSGIVCATGIVICVFFARPIICILMRKADITNDALSIMVPLLKFTGIAVTPYGLACIVINYYLARHWMKFLPYLVAGTILQISLLIMFHNSLIQVLTVLFVAGIFILLCGIPARLIERIRSSKG